MQFADGRVFDVLAGRAMVREEDGVITCRSHCATLELALPCYRAITSRRNPASVWRTIHVGRRGTDEETPLPALRDPGDERYARTQDAIATSGRVTVDLLYSDQDGGQPTITRFVLLPDAEGRWRCDVTRYWSLKS